MASAPRLREEGTLGLAAWTGQSRGMTSAHRHLDLEINYVLSGTMRYLVGGRIVELPPERLCLLWGGVPHQMIRSPRAAELIWVTIPLTTVLRWGLPDTLIRPLLAAGLLTDAAPSIGDLALLHQWLTDLPGYPGHREAVSNGSGEADDIQGIALLEIEARLRRFAVGLSRSTAESESRAPAPTHADHGLTAVEAMASFIARRFQDDIGVAQIAEEAHLHPNYAMALFRRQTGMTLAQYLVLQRVAQAQRLLATTDDPIPDIAFASGFGSVSRFYEAFRQQTGSSPRRFRLHLSGKEED